MELALVTVVVPSYEAGLSFFTQAIGWRVWADDPRPGAPGKPAKRWLVVGPGEGAPQPHRTGVLLARAEGAEQAAAIGRQTGGRVAFFLRSTDLDADRARLEGHGAVFDGPTRVEDYGRVAVFTDPFGNRWDLLQAAG